MHGVSFRSAIWIGDKIDGFTSAVWFRSANPMPNPTLIPIPNPVPNRKPNVTVSLTLSVTHVQRSISLSYITTIHTCKPNTNTQRKLTCAFVYKRQITPFFGITWFKFTTNWTKWRQQLIINRKWRRHDLNLTIFPCLVSGRRSKPIIMLKKYDQYSVFAI